MNDINLTLLAMNYGMKVPLHASPLPEFNFSYVLTDPGFIAYRLLESLEPDSDDYNHVSCFLKYWKDGETEMAEKYVLERVETCRLLTILQAAVHAYDHETDSTDVSLKMLINYLESNPDFPFRILALSLYIEWTLAYSSSAILVAQLVMQMTENEVSDFLCRLQCAHFFVYMDHFDEAIEQYLAIILNEPQKNCDILIQALARREIRTIIDDVPENLADILDKQDSEAENLAIFGNASL
jgi:uncharacterized protein YozE (UPF0346 family)